MATRKRARTQRGRRSYYGSEYVEGNAARSLSAEPSREPYGAPYEGEPRRKRKRKKSPAARRAERTSWDLFSLLFMAAALSITMYVCISYLQAQHDLAVMNKKIASMESELMELKNQNDVAYSKVDASVDLEHIYEVATKELGMVHPIKNQVFSYRNQKSNYVRQYGDIPDSQ